MLAIQIRLFANLLRLVWFTLQWVVLWPVVLVRARQRNFVRVALKGGLRLGARRGLAARLSPGPSYEALCRTLDRIERSRNVEGVLIKLGEVPMSLSVAALLRERLLQTRRAGKRVVCTFDSAGLTTLTVAGAADTVMMAPSGHILLTGFKVELTFYRRLLKRFGFRGQFIHIGRFKTAGHGFTRDHASPSQRQMTLSLLSDLSQSASTLVDRDDVVGGSKAASPTRRSVEDPAEPATEESDRRSELFTRGIFTISEARRAGLVDHQAFPDQIRTRLRAEQAGEEWDPFGTFGDESVAKEHAARLRKLKPVAVIKAGRFTRLRPRPLRLSPLRGSAPQIAVVDMSGIIVSDDATSGPIGSRPHIAPNAVRRVFKRLRENRRVRAVVLAIDSRGGSALASDLIWREVRRLRHKKPVVAALRSVAASGGYYIAVGADEIVAERTTLTGSIGVVAGKLSGELALNKALIVTETHATGPHATLMSPRHAWSDEQIDVMRSEIRSSYRRFINRVATGREISSARVHLLARGRVYTGRQAHRVGLVDALGTLETAIDRAAERAKLPRDRVRVRYHSTFAPSLQSLVLGTSTNVSDQLALLDPELPGALRFHLLLRHSPILAYFDGRIDVG